jgi:hypothetical protein
MLSCVNVSHSLTSAASRTQDVHIKCDAVLHDRVTSIMSALRSAAQLRRFAKNVDQLPFAFVTPLGAYGQSVGFNSIRCKEGRPTEYHRRHRSIAEGQLL